MQRDTKAIFIYFQCSDLIFWLILFFCVI
jgi:hypothetical protein